MQRIANPSTLTGSKGSIPLPSANKQRCLNMKTKSTKSNDDWQTPEYLMSNIIKATNVKKFFDPCPFQVNLRKFNGLDEDLSWAKWNYVNPPYSQKLKEAFVVRGVQEIKKKNNCLFLIPSSTETVLYHNLIVPNARAIIHINGRVRFCGFNTLGEWVTDKTGQSGSMFVLFGKDWNTDQIKNLKALAYNHRTLND